jgi:hypothetical protein
MLGNLGAERYDEMEVADLKETKRRCLKVIFWFYNQYLKI